MYYDFDKVIDRKNTQSSKWDNVEVRVGNKDALPMWVADMDFPCPAPVVEAVVERARHPIYGYSFVVPEFMMQSSAGLKNSMVGNLRKNGLYLQLELFQL